MRVKRKRTIGHRQTTVSVVKGKQLVEQFIKDYFADNFCGNCLKGGDETRLCCLWSVKRVYSVDIFQMFQAKRAVLIMYNTFLFPCLSLLEGLFVITILEAVK